MKKRLVAFLLAAVTAVLGAFALTGCKEEDYVITYTITYELNGGVNNPDNPVIYTIEDEIILSAPTKEGFTFLGWLEEGETFFVDKIEKGSVGNKKFIANWKQNDSPELPDTEYTVNFDLSYEIDGGTKYTTVGGKTEVSGAVIKEGEFFTGKLPRPDDRSDDYVFEGWYYIVGNEEIKVTEATAFDKTVFTGVSGNSITLTAKLGNKEYVVNFNLTYKVGNKTVQSTVGGKTEVASAKIKVGKTFGDILPAVDKRANEDDYYFKGWVYFDAQGKEVSVEDATVFNKSIFDKVENGALILVAKVGKAWIGPY